MTRDLVIVGCGGFGREVVGIVDAINATEPRPEWNILGFADDSPSTEDTARARDIGLAVIGTSDTLHSRRLSDSWFVLAIGLPEVRLDLARRIGTDNRAATLIDPAARIGRSVEIGRGTIVGPAAQITTNVSIGNHVHIDRGAHVGHDCEVDDFVTVHPAAVISGNCQLSFGARIGTGATILPGNTVGARALVGAGACATRMVEPGSVVAGVPATLRLT